MFNFLFTSLSIVLTNHITSYLSISRQSISPLNVNEGSKSFIELHTIISNTDSTGISKQFGDILISCSAYPGQTVVTIHAFVDALLTSYAEQTWDNNILPKHYQDYNCILFDGKKDALWMLSDHLGTNPIWYGFKDTYFPQSQILSHRDFMVTTDLLLGHAFGMTKLNPLGANQIMKMNLRTNGLEMIHIPKFVIDPMIQSLPLLEKTNLLISMTDTLLQETLLSPSNNNPLTYISTSREEEHWLIEHDPMYWSSIFLSCMIDYLLPTTEVLSQYPTNLTEKIITRAIRTTRPSFITHPKLEHLPIILQQLLPYLPREELDNWDYTEGYIYHLYERWLQSVSPDSMKVMNGKKIVYIAFDNSLLITSRTPLDVYFQNLICRLQNISLRYVFHNIQYQAIFASLTYSKTSTSEPIVGQLLQSEYGQTQPPQAPHRPTGRRQQDGNFNAMMIQLTELLPKHCPVEAFIGNVMPLNTAKNTEHDGSRIWDSEKEKNCFDSHGTTIESSCYERIITNTIKYIHAQNTVNPVNIVVKDEKVLEAASMTERSSRSRIATLESLSNVVNNLPMNQFMLNRKYITVTQLLPTLSESSNMVLLSNYVCSFQLAHTRHLNASTNNQNGKEMPILPLIIISPFPITKQMEDFIDAFPIVWLDISKSCPVESINTITECMDHSLVQVLQTFLSVSTLFPLSQSIEYLIVSSVLNQWIEHPLTYVTDPTVVEQTYDLHLLAEGDKQSIQSEILIFRAASTDLKRFWAALYAEYSSFKAGRKISSQLFQQKTIALNQIKFIDLLSSYIFHEGKYTQGSLAIQVLPTNSFLSAYEYFNKRSHYFRTQESLITTLRENKEDDGSGRPVVYMILNTFLVDEYATKHRLLQYGLWHYEVRDNHMYCTADIAKQWSEFIPPSQFAAQTTPANTERVHMMRIDAPVHHTNYESNDILQFVMNIESHMPIAEAQFKVLHGLQQQQHQQTRGGTVPMGNTGTGRKFYDYEKMHVYIDSEAFYGFEYATAFLLTMNKSIPMGSGGMRYADHAPKIAYQSDENLLLSNERFGVSMLIPKTNMQATIDIAPKAINTQLGEYYGIDYAGVNTETLFATAMRTHSKTSPSALPQLDANIIRDVEFEAFDPTKPVTYTIKVLAFTRTKSLSRLLNSLVNAWYHKENPLNATSNNQLLENVDLDILVDGYRNAKEALLVQSVIQFANEFSWPFGRKSVMKRETNIGLAGQWAAAWNPSNGNEFAFIFEDDLEISPYYFQWATQVIHKYYQQRPEQSQLQVALLQKVIALTTQSTSTSTPNEARIGEELAEFVSSYAGTEHVMTYGICLQKQALDPTRYPKTARMQTGHRPYLYSAVGTWGPVFYPTVWKAFLLWWQWRRNVMIPVFSTDILGRTTTISRPYKPRSDKLVSNRFLMENAHVWSPWLTRFVYEIGGKCIYQNLPGNLTMVNNHREGGENYYYTWGAYARLLSSSHLQTIYAFYQQPTTNAVEVSSSIQAYEAKESVDTLGIYLACSYLPDWKEMVVDWQYDFNGHQIMKLGMQNAYPHAVMKYAEHQAFEMQSNNEVEVEKYIADAISPYEKTLQWFTTLVNTHYSQEKTTMFPVLSLVAWIEYRNLLVGILPPFVQLHYFEVFPLMQLFSNYYTHSDHYLYTSEVSICDQFRKQQHSYLHCMSLHGSFPSYHPEKAHHRADLRTPVLQFEANALMITFPLLSHHPDKSKKTFLTLPSLGRQFEYIVIFDMTICVGAPMEIQFFDEQNGGANYVEYIQISSLCDVSPTDHGVVVYRQKARLDGIEGQASIQNMYQKYITQPRFLISKRITSSLVSSETINVDSNSLFV